jgi:1,4-dihydroxy-2-naphthoate octaprenyltransferase
VYALGVAIALGRGAALNGTSVSGGLLALLPVAASVHFANEYADFETDRLTTAGATRTPFSGGSGALHAASLPRSVARNAMLITGAAGIGISVSLTLMGTLTPTMLGLLALIAVLGWAYSLPPVRLSARGLGEIDNTIVGGLLLPLYGAATLTTPSISICLAVVPFALLVFANLLATQWPDRWADAYTRKFTLPTRWSPQLLRRVHLLTVIAAFALLPPLTGRVLPPMVTTTSLLAAPFAFWGVRTFTNDEWPFPTVAAMVTMAVTQLVAWTAIAGLLPPLGAV